MKAANTPRHTFTRTCAALLTAALASTAALAQETPATVPSSFEGTYELTYDYAQAGSPISNGTAVTVVIAPGNTMCVGGYTLTNPVLRNGNQHEAIWKESTVGIELALSSLVNGYNEINVGSTSGTWWGQLRGSKTSTSTTGCGSTTTPTPDLTKINELFTKAQEKFAQYFPASANAVNQTLEGYTYRHYPSTGMYLAIADGKVYVMGGEYGNSPKEAGTLDAILSELTGTTVEIPSIPEGDYRLTVTGTLAAEIPTIPGFPGGGFGVAVDFPTLIKDNIDPPKSSDIDDIRDAVKSALDSVNFVGDINVSEVNNSSAAFTFVIEFVGSSTAEGITTKSNYKLRYEYTKL
ncbi:MAG: hypothetical protein KDI28_11885 [Pseudomonadales bacterium]|nr:hypothetical protein [Pseudomonadales bacterium]